MNESNKNTFLTGIAHKINVKREIKKEILIKKKFSIKVKVVKKL